MCWPHIEHNMKTRKDCYHFLTEKLSEQRVDSYPERELFLNIEKVLRTHTVQPRAYCHCKS